MISNAPCGPVADGQTCAQDAPSGHTEIASGQDSRLLDTVLNNMAQGVLMFDAAGHLLFYNRRYVEMYGLTKDFAKPGCMLRDLCDQLPLAGCKPEEIGEYVAELETHRAQGTVFSRTVKLDDDRVFSIEDRPLDDGGWLSTHENVTERFRAQAQIAHMARHDILTGLPNRLLLRERLESDLKRLQRSGGCLALFCLDLDHFKPVNDTLGHPTGDSLLVSVGERLRGCIREIDTIARLGGDEFAIVMTQFENPGDAAVLAQRIRECIIRPYLIDGHQIKIDISIGVSLAPADGIDADRLLKNADKALYGAKGDGRGQYRFFEQEMDQRMQRRRSLEIDLRNALMNRRFELYYQPLVNVQTNVISAFEALIRWNHPTQGLILPGEFIPMAEETKLMVPIGEWVLRTACREAVNWPEHVKVAVNLSPIQLKDRKLIDVVKSSLAESGLAPSRLQLEITESILMQNTFATLAMLHALRKLGVQIAMDDFGADYSSLGYLRSFPFDKIKIDRSLVEDIPDGGQRGSIVSAVAGLTNCLNMMSSAERVETDKQRAAFQGMGCAEMQGYFFGEPKPASELARFLAEHRVAIASNAA